MLPQSVHHSYCLLLILLIFNSSQARVGRSQATSGDTGSSSESDDNNGVSNSSTIPSLRDTMELGHLSSIVYGFRHYKNPDCSVFPTIFEEYIKDVQPQVLIQENATFICHMYEDEHEQDTQIMIVSKEMNGNNNNSSESHHHQGYVAIVFAGTDDFRNIMTDLNDFTKVFGPTTKDGKHPLAPSDSVRVHAGFNNAVFRNGLFDRIYKVVSEVKGDNPGYRLMTTGHSLGAADAILTAVALKLQNNTWTDELILSINYGCPKTGNRPWRNFVNSMDGLGIWRVVNGIDLVPRMPGPTFHHVGHTLQFDGDAARAFWLHNGDKKLGFRGVPFGWNTKPYALAPAAAVDHMIGRYIKYLDTKSGTSRKYYIDSFERINAGEDDDYNPDFVDDDDLWPDDDINFETEQYEKGMIDISAEAYLKLLSLKENEDHLFQDFFTEQIAM